MQDFMLNLPYKPYCANEFSGGTKVLPLKMALGYKYIQLNPPQRKSFLIFDIDRTGAALAAEDADLPAPTMTVVNPANRHAHVIYALSAPVCMSDNAHDEPQRYVEAIEGAYLERLGADPGYCGLLAKNPWHTHWDTMENGNAVYLLSELADYVELPLLRKKNLRTNSLGRNCTLFDTLRIWAYKTIKNYWQPEGEGKWQEAVMLEASRSNVFDETLSEREVRCIGRSVARWTWRHIKPVSREYIEKTHTPEAQRARRSKLTRKQEAIREQGFEMMREGKSNTEIVKELGAGERTVERWRSLYRINAISAMT
jgi:hypothetical protein